MQELYKLPLYLNVTRCYFCPPTLVTEATRDLMNLPFRVSSQSRTQPLGGTSSQPAFDLRPHEQPHRIPSATKSQRRCIMRMRTHLLRGSSDPTGELGPRWRVRLFGGQSQHRLCPHGAPSVVRPWGGGSSWAVPSACELGALSEPGCQGDGETRGEESHGRGGHPVPSERPLTTVTK